MLPFTAAIHIRLLTLRLAMTIGGDKRDRTADLLRARQALSQLSYIPIQGTGIRIQVSVPNLTYSFHYFLLSLQLSLSVPKYLFWYLTPDTWYLKVVGLSGLEPPTSPLSGVRSNHLSYRPKRIRFVFLCSSLVYNYQTICVNTCCHFIFSASLGDNPVTYIL